MKKSQRRTQNNNSTIPSQKKGQSISVSNPGTYRAPDLNTQLKPRMKRDTTNQHLLNALNEIDGTRKQIDEQKQQLQKIKSLKIGDDKTRTIEDKATGIVSVNLANHLAQSPIGSRNNKSRLADQESGRRDQSQNAGQDKKGLVASVGKVRDSAALQEYLEAPVRAELVLDDDYEDVNDSMLAEKPDAQKKEGQSLTQGSSQGRQRSVQKAAQDIQKKDKSAERLSRVEVLSQEAVGYQKSIDYKHGQQSFDNTPDQFGNSSRLSTNEQHAARRAKEITQTLSHMKPTKSSSMKRKQNFLSSSKLGLNTSTSNFHEQSAYRSNPKDTAAADQDSESGRPIQIIDNNNKYFNKNQKMKKSGIGTIKNNSPKRKSEAQIAPATTPNKKSVLSLERQAALGLRNSLANKSINQQFQTTLPNRKSEAINSKKPTDKKNQSSSKLGIRNTVEAKTPAKFKKSTYINSQKKISNVQGLASAKQMLNQSITSTGNSSAAQFNILKTNNYLNSATPQNSRPIQLQTVTSFDKKEERESRVGIHQQANILESSRQNNQDLEPTKSRQLITSPFKSKVQLIMESTNSKALTKSTMAKNYTLESSSNRRANKPSINPRKDESHGGGARIFNSKSPSKKSLQLQQILKSISMNAASNPGAQVNRKRNAAGGAQATPDDSGLGGARNMRNQPQNPNIHSHTKSYQALDASDDAKKGSNIYNLLSKPSSHVNPYIQTKNRLVSVGSKLETRSQYNFPADREFPSQDSMPQSQSMLTSPLVSSKIGGALRDKTAEPIGQAQNIKLKIESNISNNYYNKRNTSTKKNTHVTQKSQDLTTSPKNGQDFKSHTLLTDRSEQMPGREKNNGLIDTYKRPTQAKKTLEIQEESIRIQNENENNNIGGTTKEGNNSIDAQTVLTAFKNESVDVNSVENVDTLSGQRSHIKTPRKVSEMSNHIKSKKLGDDYLNIVKAATENASKEENSSINESGYKPGVKHMEISFQDETSKVTSSHNSNEVTKRQSKLLQDAEAKSNTSAQKKKKSRNQKSGKKQKQTPQMAESSVSAVSASAGVSRLQTEEDQIEKIELPEPVNLYSEFSPNFGNKEVNSNSKVNLIEPSEPFVADLNQPQIKISNPNPTKNAFTTLGEVAEGSHESQTQVTSKFVSLIDDEKTFSNKYQTHNDDQYPMTANQFLLLYKSKMLDEEIRELGSGPNQFKTIYYAGTITTRHGDDLDILKSVNQERKQIFEEKIKSDEDHSNGEYQGNPMFDNFEGYYRVQIGEHISYRYEIMKVLGKGSFAQVVQCRDHKQKDKPIVALKITRNTEMDHKFAHKEAQYLSYIMQEDPHDKHNIVRMLDQCYFREHQCFVFELLHTDLFEHLKATGFVGFSTDKIRDYTLQILKGLVFLEKHKIIHCDLKPENILCADTMCRNLKIVDFGSGCFRDEQIYTYVQSRFYRSPEVILRIKYSEKVDIWSLGCILAELYTGEPIFPGNNEQEQLELIMELSGMPPESMIDKSRKKDHYFDTDYSPFLIEDEELGILRIPSSRNLSDAIPCEDNLFLDFVQQCLEIDPETRFSASEAMEHPWIKEAIQSQIRKNKMLERTQKKTNNTNKRMGQNESNEQIYHPQIIREKDAREREGDGAKEIPAEFSPERDILVQRKKQVQKPNTESFGIKLNNLNFNTGNQPVKPAQKQQATATEVKVTDFIEEQKLANAALEPIDQPHEKLTHASTSTGKFNKLVSSEVYQTNESITSSQKYQQNATVLSKAGSDEKTSPTKNNYFSIYKPSGLSDVKKKSIIPDMDYTNKYVRRQSAIASRNDTGTNATQTPDDKQQNQPHHPLNNNSPFRNKFINMTAEEIENHRNYDDSSAPLNEESHHHREISSGEKKKLQHNNFFPSQ